MDGVSVIFGIVSSRYRRHFFDGMEVRIKAFEIMTMKAP
jgi:hypothetical protein